MFAGKNYHEMLTNYFCEDDFPAIPDTMKLIEGPVAFRMSLNDVNSDEDVDKQGIEALCHFIGMYVGGTYGVQKITKWLKDNKGKSFLDLMTVDDVAWCVVLVENHVEGWERDMLKARSADDEKEKYKNYRDIVDEEERAKYAPRPSRYSSGDGIKREFGKEIWSEEGHQVFQEVKKNWSEALSDKNTWLWMVKGWDEWVEHSGFCRHWRLKESGKRRGIAEDVEEEEQVACTFLLPGDEGFVDGKIQEWGGGESDDTGDESNIEADGREERGSKDGGGEVGVREGGEEMRGEVESGTHEKTRSKSNRKRRR